MNVMGHKPGLAGRGNRGDNIPSVQVNDIRAIDVDCCSKRSGGCRNAGAATDDGPARRTAKERKHVKASDVRTCAGIIWNEIAASIFAARGNNHGANRSAGR